MARGTGATGCSGTRAKARGESCKHEHTVEIGRRESRTDYDVDVELECLDCGARTSSYTPGWVYGPRTVSAAMELAELRARKDAQLLAVSRQLTAPQEKALTAAVKRNGPELWLSKLGRSGIAQISWAYDQHLPDLYLAPDGSKLSFSTIRVDSAVPPAPAPVVINDCSHERTVEIGRSESATDYDVDIEIECTRCGARRSSYGPGWGAPRPIVESDVDRYRRVWGARSAAIAAQLTVKQAQAFRRLLSERGLQVYAERLGKSGIVKLHWNGDNASDDVLLTVSGRRAEFSPC